MTIETMGALVPVIIGLVGVFTMAGMNKKYAPLLSLLLGLFLVSLSVKFKVNYAVVLVGLITGLSASGLYSGTKKTVEIFTDKK